jgi:hypothetical protein
LPDFEQTSTENITKKSHFVECLDYDVISYQRGSHYLDYFKHQRLWLFYAPMVILYQGGLTNVWVWRGGDKEVK